MIHRERIRSSVENGLDPEELGIVQKARTGDKQAFEQLYKLHYHQILRHINSMLRNEAQAEEVTQEAFIRAWDNLDKFDGRAKFNTWLTTIAHNAALDALRKKRRRPETNDPTMIPRKDEKDEAAVNAEAVLVEHAQDPLAFKDMVDILEEKDRIILTMKYVDGLTYPQIAEKLGIPEGTVMSRLFYARKKLKQMLKSNEQL